MTLLKVNNRPVGKTFDNLFDELFNGFPSAYGNTVKEDTGVAANIHETKDAYHLELNVPGRNKEDFKVNVENGILTVSFEQKDENKSEEYKTIRREYNFRSFKRSFTLGDKIDVNNIQAKYENGILKFYLPKKEELKAEVKQISVQ